MKKRHLKNFYRLSVTLTGFSELDLRATGVGEEYYAELIRYSGFNNVDELLRETENLLSENPDTLNQLERFRAAVWNDPRFGPMARSMVKMWYLGNWTSLPDSWLEKYGETNPMVIQANLPHVVSAQAYREGLVWRALGTHSPGAKAPGYGSWAQPPTKSNEAV